MNFTNLSKEKSHQLTYIFTAKVNYNLNWCFFFQILLHQSQNFYVSHYFGMDSEVVWCCSSQKHYLGIYILYIFYILKHKNCVYDCSYMHFKWIKKLNHMKQKKKKTKKKQKKIPQVASRALPGPSMPKWPCRPVLAAAQSEYGTRNVRDGCCQSSGDLVYAKNGV